MDKNELIRLYESEGKSLDDIGEIYNCSRINVYYFMKKYNIPVRNKQQARKLVYDKGKIKVNKFNEKIFDRWTNKSAYLLGLIYTDGSMSYTMSSGKLFKKTSFSQKDPSFMNKVIELFSFEGKILKNKRTDVLTINMSSIYMANRLEKLGVHPNKSFTLKFPNIPDKYISHFIRGVFDGDGHISKQKMTITGASLDFFKTMKGILNDNNIEAKIYKHGSKYYTLRINKKNVRKLFGEYIYKNSRGMYFERKYNTFKKLELI